MAPCKQISLYIVSGLEPLDFASVLMASKMTAMLLDLLARLIISNDY